MLQILPTLDRSGTAKQLVLLATRLPPAEFDVHVCALARGGPLAADLQAVGIPLTVIGQAWKLDPAAIWRLKQHIAAIKPDLVQTWTFTANAYGRAAALAAGVRHLVASERCVDSWKRWPQWTIDRRLARRTEAITVNGRGVRQFYSEHGLPANKLRLIYNGIEPAPAMTVSREQLLSELGLPAGARLIGAVGPLSPQKRIKDLIWTTDLLKVIRNDVHLLVIGEAPQRAALERYRRLCKITEHVHFLGARNDVPRLMPHFDLLCLASDREGLPNVVMEAMAAGVPVVATDIWGPRELVVHGETGYLVQVGDRAGMARSANKILDDSALAARLGAAGRQRVGLEFPVETMVEKHAALYRELWS